MTHLDGNSLAGPLAEFFTFDVTTAVAKCEGCGSIAELARAMVFSGAGSVVRCSSCGQVLITLVESEDRAWIRFTGMGAIQIARSLRVGALSGLRVDERPPDMDRQG